MPGFLPPPGISGFPISGTDWADGSIIGTPTPAGARVLNVSPFNIEATGTFFEELPDSPEMEFGEVATISHRFRCDWTTGSLYFQGLPRGSFMVDSTGVLSAVLNTKLQRLRGNTALFTVIAESVLDPPQDECSVTPSEFNLAIEKHPRYHEVLFYNLTDAGNIIDNTNPWTGPYLIQFLKNHASSPQQLNAANDLAWLNAANIDGWDDPVVFIADIVTLGDLITELIYAYRRGETEFYLSGWEVKWTFFYFNLAPIAGTIPQILYPADEGGYLQDPVKSGFLPSYFWSLDGSVDTSDENNLLARLPVQDAVGLYSDPSVGQFSWLKFADEVRFERNLVRQTLTWVGGPLGIWDQNIYPIWDGTGLRWV